MQISVIHRTSTYRGDHAADVGIAVAVKPGETVEQLVERLLTREEGIVEPQRVGIGVDWLELRVVIEPGDPHRG